MILFGALVLITTGLTTYLTYIFQTTWPIILFPIIGGSVLILGLHIEEGALLDFGTFLLTGSFFFTILDLDINYLNFLIVILCFFFFFGLWAFMRREMILKQIERELIGNEGLRHLDEYKKHSVIYYTKSVFTCLCVAVLGGIIASNSFVGPFPDILSVIINITFSLAVLASIYIVLIILPRYYTFTEDREKES